MPLSVLLLAAALQAPPAAADDRPTIVATGEGEVTRPVDWTRLGFTLRGEGVTAGEATAALARAQATAVASLRALKGVTLEIQNTGVASQDVRGAACSPNNAYAASQRLSVGECAIVGVIATLEVQVRVAPADRTGDVASLASQMGGRNVGLRSSGLDSEPAAQREAASRAVAEARRQAETMATAAGGRLGRLVRVQDGASYGFNPTAAPGAPPAPPPPLALPMVAQARALESPLEYIPGPVTRSARVTVVYELQPAQP